MKTELISMTKFDNQAVLNAGKLLYFYRMKANS
jgi:hypothetical protein